MDQELLTPQVALEPEGRVSLPRVLPGQASGLPPRVGTGADVRVGSEWAWPALLGSAPLAHEEFHLSHHHFFMGGGVSDPQGRGQEGAPRLGKAQPLVLIHACVWPGFNSHL